MKKIQVYPNKGTRPYPYPKIENKEMVKIHCQHYKIFSSRTNKRITTKPGSRHHWMKGIQVCSNKDTCSSKERLKRNSENTLSRSKNLSLKNHRTNFNQTWHKAFLGECPQIVTNKNCSLLKNKIYFHLINIMLWS